MPRRPEKFRPQKFLLLSAQILVDTVDHPDLERRRCPSPCSSIPPPMCLSPLGPCGRRQEYSGGASRATMRTGIISSARSPTCFAVTCCGSMTLDRMTAMGTNQIPKDEDGKPAFRWRSRFSKLFAEAAPGLHHSGQRCSGNPDFAQAFLNALMDQYLDFIARTSKQGVSSSTLASILQQRLIGCPL